VSDRLIDLWKDPLKFGREEPDRPGLFTTPVPGTNLEIHFVLDVDRRDECVFSIVERDPFHL
jgi:hypothetical protein